jgi:hypothetical protein
MKRVQKKKPSIGLQPRSRSHELGGWSLILQNGEDLRCPWGLRETQKVIVVRRMPLAGENHPLYHPLWNSGGVSGLATSADEDKKTD